MNNKKEKQIKFLKQINPEKLNLPILHLSESPKSSQIIKHNRNNANSSFHLDADYIPRFFYKRTSLIISYDLEKK